MLVENRCLGGLVFVSLHDVGTFRKRLEIRQGKPCLAVLMLLQQPFQSSFLFCKTLSLRKFRLWFYSEPYIFCTVDFTGICYQELVAGVRHVVYSMGLRIGNDNTSALPVHPKEIALAHQLGH